jgi:hypothetical protein
MKWYVDKHMGDDEWERIDGPFETADEAEEALVHAQDQEPLAEFRTKFE